MKLYFIDKSFLSRIVLLSLLIYCGEDSLLDCEKNKPASCDQPTKDEQAILDLNEKKYDEVIRVLSELQKEFPTEYFRYPVLASAYAGKAGFDIPQMILSSDGKPEKMLESLSEVKEEDGLSVDDKIKNLTTGRDLILSMPEDERKSTSDKYYASSAEIQLQIYQLFITNLMLSKFTSMKDGKMISDPEALAKMTDEEAISFLNELAKGSQISTSSGELSQLSGGLNKQFLETQGKINAEEGENSSEKLKSFINGLGE